MIIGYCLGDLYSILILNIMICINSIYRFSYGLVQRFSYCLVKNISCDSVKNISCDSVKNINKIKNKLNLKVFDCFTYFNEIDLLKYRIAHCYDYVDYFIIIEADKTHTGMDKHTKLDLNLIDSKFHDKIIYEYINFPYELEGKCLTTAWKREHYQREQIKPHLKKLANKHDMIPMSIHKKPPCSKSSRVRILARISKKSPVDKSAMGK